MEEDGSWELKLVPMVDDVLHHDAFLEVLDLEKEKWNSISRRLGSIRRNMTQLKEGILRELNK